MNNKVLFGGLFLVVVTFFMIGCKGFPEKSIEVIDLKKTINLSKKKKLADAFLSLTIDEIMALSKMSNQQNGQGGINQYMQFHISDNCDYDEKGALKTKAEFCGIIKKDNVCIDIECLEAFGEDLDEGCANGDCNMSFLFEKWKLYAYLDPLLLQSKKIQFNNIPKGISIQKVTLEMLNNRGITLEKFENSTYGLSENINISTIYKKARIDVHIREDGHDYVLSLVK